MNETETKSDDNLMAVIAYLFCPITGLIIYLMEKDKPDKRRFVMFHAVQSIILGIVFVAIYFFLGIINIIPIIGNIISLIGFLIVPLAGLVVWIFMLYKAYSGEEYHLPVIGDYTEQYI
jgi:uncharacterized membrane protein